MKIELTDPEAQALFAYIDIAVKQQGLNAAQTALNIVAKIAQAQRDEQSQPQTPPVGNDAPVQPMATAHG